MIVPFNLQNIKSWLSSISARERFFLCSGAVILFCSFCYLICLEPALTGRRQLIKEIPSSRKNLAIMEMLATEAQNLKSYPIEPVEKLEASLKKSIKDAGLISALTELTFSADTFKVHFEGVSYPDWITWVYSLSRNSRIRVLSVTITNRLDLSASPTSATPTAQTLSKNNQNQADLHYSSSSTDAKEKLEGISNQPKTASEYSRKPDSGISVHLTLGLPRSVVH